MQIDAAKQELADTALRTAEYTATYQKIIDDSEATLSQYRKRVKELEAHISGCRQMIQSTAVDNRIADEKVRDAVEILIGRQKF